MAKFFTTLSTHQVKVAKAIIAHVFGEYMGKASAKNFDSDFVYKTIDESPRYLASIAENHGWFEVNSDGRNGRWMRHEDYPGAVMEVNFNDEGRHEGLVIIFVDNKNHQRLVKAKRLAELKKPSYAGNCYYGIPGRQ